MKNIGLVVLFMVVFIAVCYAAILIRDYWAWNVAQANKKEAAALAEATTQATNMKN